MEIHIRLHGMLREKLPREAKGKTTLQLAPGSKVADVLSYFEINRLVGVAVNEEVEVEPDHPLKAGDKVEIFRIASGGSSRFTNYLIT